MNPFSALLVIFRGSNLCHSVVVEDTSIEEPSLGQQGTSLKNLDTDDFQEDMLQKIYEQATEVSASSALV